MQTDRIREIVARADLHYEGVAKRSEGGLPLGNGVMASLVWTSPTAIKLQVNRCDVYGNDSYTNSFPDRHLDYAYGCAFVDIDFADFGDDLFNEQTRQHLDLYRAEGKIVGGNTETTFFACENMDAFCFHVRDDRPTPESINIKLKNLRNMEVQTANHSAVSKFEMIDDVMVLSQTFTEDNYYCSSAVAIKVVGKPVKMRFNNENGGVHMGVPGRHVIVLGMETEREMRLCVEPTQGEFDIYISSFATFDRTRDVPEMAAAMATRAALIGRAQLQAHTEKVWADFWQKSYIELWGNEDAKMVETHYQYFMYVMGVCSKNGKYPPNYGGMLLLTRGDPRLWGAMQWWNNLSLYYDAIMASGHYELVMPYLSHYNLMRDRLEAYARQQWDSEGLFIPETMGFDGPEILDDEMAKEMSDLMLERKPWSEKSEKFWKTALKKRPHEARWNFIGIKSWEKGELTVKDRGLYAAVTHMMGSQVGVAYTYWEYFQYSGDKAYLREYGYPIISGIAEFFRTYPNVRKDEDGKYHIYGTNCGENYYGSKDSMESILAMYVIFPIAIEAAKALGVDEDKVALWSDMLSKLAPIPSTAHPDFTNPNFDKTKPVWINAVGKYVISEHDLTDHFIASVFRNPAGFCEMCTAETQYTDPECYEISQRWLDLTLEGNTLMSRKIVSEMSRAGRVLAHLGRSEELAVQIVNQLNCINADLEYCSYSDNGRVPVFENRLTSREGVNAMSAQRLGNCAIALQRAVLQSGGGSAELPGVINLFPAMPKEWNARFRLFAKNGFRVESSCIDGKIGDTTIYSDLGDVLKVRCPYEKGMSVQINGEKAVKVKGSGTLYETETKKGDVITITEL